jgi:hypothetical protein
MLPARMTMFCMISSCVSCLRDRPFDKTLKKPVGRRVHGGQHGHRTPPEDRGGAGRTPTAANTARTDAGLRAGDQTGLGDCQSKGWPRRQTCGESACQTLTSRQPGQPDPQSSTSLGTKAAITSLRHPCPPSGSCGTLPRRAIGTGAFRTRFAPMADHDLEALSLSELKKM